MGIWQSLVWCATCAAIVGIVAISSFGIPQKLPSGAVAAAWAQAIFSGLAILVSGGFAVWVPARERRIKRREEAERRLEIETLNGPHSLKLRVRYSPQRTDAAIWAVVSVPEDECVVEAGVLNPVSGRDQTWWKEDIDAIRGKPSCRVKLKRLPAGDEDRLAGLAFIMKLGGDAPERVRVTISIYSDAQPVPLIRRSTVVSSID